MLGIGECANRALVAGQHGRDEPRAGRRERALKGEAIAGIDDAHADRREPAAAGDEILVMGRPLRAHAPTVGLAGEDMMNALRHDSRMNGPIVTVTLNPAVDEAIAISELELGGVNRCTLGALDAGGKGINAGRVIHRLGRETIAIGFVGGVTGALIRSCLDGEGVPHAFDDVAETTRLNMMLYERASRRRTRLYLPGARVEPARLRDIYARLGGVGAGAVVVLGGSLPPGLADSTYHDLVRFLRERGAVPILDTSGAALLAALPARPALIKPNLEEAGEVLGRTIAGDDGALAAARELRAMGAAGVVISQGAQAPSAWTIAARGRPCRPGWRPIAPWGRETRWSPGSRSRCTRASGWPKGCASARRPERERRRRPPPTSAGAKTSTVCSPGFAFVRWRTNART